MATQLSKWVIELRAMNQAQVADITRAELAKAARPFAPTLRAAILNVPVLYGSRRTPGLRTKIAACVETFATVQGTLVRVGIAVNAQKMPDGEHSLPLMMNGNKPWRHPLFGDREVWVAQDSHPYFDEAMAGMGPASQRAVQRALDTISARIGGTA
jgi:hypothetical protein